MKYLFLLLLSGSAFAAAPADPLKQFTAVGVCYAAPGCAGEKLRVAVTEKYCASIGGHSIHFTTLCKNL
jgi:hypothetical protein